MKFSDFFDASLGKGFYKDPKFIQYKIAVMQWATKGGKVGKVLKGESPSRFEYFDHLNPSWNWEKYDYVPLIEEKTFTIEPFTVNTMSHGSCSLEESGVLGFSVSNRNGDDLRFRFECGGWMSAEDAAKRGFGRKVWKTELVIAID